MHNQDTSASVAPTNMRHRRSISSASAPSANQPPASSPSPSPSPVPPEPPRKTGRHVRSNSYAASIAPADLVTAPKTDSSVVRLPQTPPPSARPPSSADSPGGSRRLAFSSAYVQPLAPSPTRADPASCASMRATPAAAAMQSPATTAALSDSSADAANSCPSSHVQTAASDMLSESASHGSVPTRVPELSALDSATPSVANAQLNKPATTNQTTGQSMNPSHPSTSTMAVDASAAAPAAEPSRHERALCDTFDQIRRDPTVDLAAARHGRMRRSVSAERCVDERQRMHDGHRGAALRMPSSMFPPLGKPLVARFASGAMDRWPPEAASTGDEREDVPNEKEEQNAAEAPAAASLDKLVVQATPRSEKPVQEGVQLDSPTLAGNASDFNTVTESFASSPSDDDKSTATIPVRGQPQACLFVASLCSSKTDLKLQESVTRHFKPWGELLNVKVLKDWMNRPYAFVQFANVEDAQRAMVEAHNTIIDGRHIRIEQAKVNRTLFIARLDISMSEEEIRKVLSQYGPVEELSIARNPGTGRIKGSAFAKFCFREDALTAYSGLRTMLKWSVEWASNLERGSPDVDRLSIFVGNLNPAIVTDALLYERFGVYGQIEYLNLVNRPPQAGAPARPAFAFIEFLTETAAEMAVHSENGETWLDRTIRVQFREVGNPGGGIVGGVGSFHSAQHHGRSRYNSYVQSLGHAHGGQTAGAGSVSSGFSNLTLGNNDVESVAAAAANAYIGWHARHHSTPAQFPAGAQAATMTQVTLAPMYSFAYPLVFGPYAAPAPPPSAFGFQIPAIPAHPSMQPSQPAVPVTTAFTTAAVATNAQAHSAPSAVTNGQVPVATAVVTVSAAGIIQTAVPTVDYADLYPASSPPTATQPMLVPHMINAEAFVPHPQFIGGNPVAQAPPAGMVAGPAMIASGSGGAPPHAQAPVFFSHAAAGAQDPYGAYRVATAWPSVGMMQQQHSATQVAQQ